MDSVHLSPLEFFQQAGPVGKAVIILLVAASIWCWVLIIEGVVGVARMGAALRRWRRGEDARLLAPLLKAGQAAATRVIADEGTSAVRQRVVEAMNRAARGVIKTTEGGMANLAVIASVAPFVGLFGTVWGIMASFSAIAAAKDTSLAVVAPGIAEALATTAVGLAAAIPASIGYTRLGSAVGSAAQELAGLIEERAVDLVARAPSNTQSIETVSKKEAA
jgi:biopolymer transport protein ExbB/TolQ